MKDSTYKIVFIPIFFFGLLDILDFFFKDYNDRNDYELNLSTYVIVFSITLVFILAYVYRNSQEKDRVIKFIKGFAYGVFFGFITVFYIGMVKGQTAFYLNKLFPQELIKEDFKITYRHVSKGDNLVGLRSINSNHWFGTKNKFSMENLIYIQKNDTITLEFGIGLLNKPFLPNGEIEIIK